MFPLEPAGEPVGTGRTTDESWGRAEAALGDGRSESSLKGVDHVKEHSEE